MRYQHVLLDRFQYAIWDGRVGLCRIECIPATSERIAVIATELKDNQGMSITNAAEFVTTALVRTLNLDPFRMIWIEHYGYPDPVRPERPRTYDLVTFLSVKPDCDPIFLCPRWRPMKEEEWRDLGLTPRS